MLVKSGDKIKIILQEATTLTRKSSNHLLDIPRDKLLTMRSISSLV